jgi:GNAT superfamily N-acetyltransferase
MTEACVEEEKKVRKKKEETGQIVLEVRRLTGDDLPNPESAERILKVISQLISNEDVLDFSVLSDPDTLVMGIFEGVRIDGEFTDALLIGMATANFKHTWTGWKIIVDDVIIFSNNRHHGVGRKLMEKMEELGARHDPPCKAVVLTSNRDDAFAFYYRINYDNRGGVEFKKKL